jgi:hypothetical protein
MAASVSWKLPALGAISLLGAWLLVRVPRRQPLAASTTLAVVAALFPAQARVRTRDVTGARCPPDPQS